MSQIVEYRVLCGPDGLGKVAPSPVFVNAEKLCELFKSLTIGDVRYVQMEEVNVTIPFHDHKDIYHRVAVSEEFYPIALNAILDKKLYRITINGSLRTLEPLDPAVHIERLVLCLFTIPQNQFFVSLSLCKNITAISTDNINDNNFVALASALKTNRVVQDLRVGGLNEKSEKALIDLVIHDCFLRVLGLRCCTSIPILHTIITYGTSLQKLCFSVKSEPPDSIWDSLESNCTIQELEISEACPHYLQSLFERIKGMQRNRVLQKATVKRDEIGLVCDERLFKRNVSYTKTDLKENKPDVRVLDGFTMTQLEEWMESDDAKDVRKLVITRVCFS